ncbi:MAG: DUF340 domain-containing protein [Spirochaetaceae bacterium]|jgi:hypothetical protein|nr:DUF340 domain-containing protein [Spirochaetaceae bacterium]
MKLLHSFIVLLIVGAMSLVANFIGYKNPIIDALPGMLILIALAIAGILLARVFPKIPAAAYIVTLGCIITYPRVPGAAFINAAIAKVSFMSLTTPILAYAGIAIGKDLGSFKKSGWRIIVLACVVFIGTFIGSAIIAEIVLRLLGQI